ncbi:MAG: hypothetical protein J5988_05560 [Eubacterium sp.]|nr:hypothetical protein [Lachnospiraceae bacterium]MBO5486382.1 hypothetical protein [Eubacterium sp.]
MKNEKLEDIKVMSTVSFVILFAMTIVVIAGELDSIRTGDVSFWFLILIFAICTAGSLLTAIVSSHILKKRQGKSYFSNIMYIEAFLEVFFPALSCSHSARMKKRSISEKDKKTGLWQNLCSGCDTKRIISFILWFLLWAACIWLVIKNIFYLSSDDRIMDITTFSIALIVLTFILIGIASGIKKDPTPIFEYMDITKVKFHELAKHYDNSNKIACQIWMDDKYIFIQASGKAYCIPVADNIDMTITFSRFHFVMILTSKYDCVTKSAFFPFGFQKLKKRLENRQQS